MKKIINKLLVLSLISLTLTSCNFENFTGVEGKGEVVKKEIVLSENFHKVDVERGWNVLLVKSSENKVTVEANENLIELIQTNITENELEVTSEKNIGQADKKMVTIYYTQDLTEIEASAGSMLNSQDVLKANSLEISCSSGALVELKVENQTTNVETSSGANFTVTGNTKTLSVDASSGSSFDAQQLKAENVTAEASSGASVNVYASKQITAEASSGGNIDYWGNPENKNIEDSVSGSVSEK
ncbi:head GIN domain-containing protein [Mesonia sp. K7]|uniref:head GIN domain-containing protein n=1 Tax=Mesonia sp. K7 TaxID=2218606 RepID=UPI000DA8F43A|nr:head GIN domain-containing protein [Mesonia sp. K7]PZD79473.1 DUF2807 domain-containing protein [Mesonia sp. K7]